MRAWLTDLRKTAFLAAIGLIAGIVLGVPTISTQFSRALSDLNHPGPGVLIFVFGFALIVGLPLIGIPIGLLISLYRTKTAVRIPDRLRILAWLASAIAIGLAVWSRQFYFTAPGLAYLNTSGAILRFALAFLVDVAGILFLVALSSQPGDVERPEAPDDRLLRRLAKTGTIIWGIILIGIIWATGYTAFYYREMQQQYFQNLQAFVPLNTLMWEKLRQLLQQAIIFVPFFVIHRGIVERQRLETASTPSGGADVIKP